MAVTKIWAIHDSVSRVVDYCTNPSKTKLSDLEQVLLYAADKEKNLDEGEQQYAVTGIGCRAESAAREMAAVQRRFGKAGGNVAYHAYQSFKTGEVTAEECHRIGVETARRLWGNDRQVLVATHFNTGTYHNHFVVNPVNMWTGKKLEAKYEVYYKLRDMSDRVCKEHGLSVIVTGQGKGKSYIEHQAERAGTSYKAKLRAAIDRLLPGRISPLPVLRGEHPRDRVSHLGKHLAARTVETGADLHGAPIALRQAHTTRKLLAHLDARRASPGLKQQIRVVHDLGVGMHARGTREALTRTVHQQDALGASRRRVNEQRLLHAPQARHMHGAVSVDGVGVASPQRVACHDERVAADIEGLVGTHRKLGVRRMARLQSARGTHRGARAAAHAQVGVDVDRAILHADGSRRAGLGTAHAARVAVAHHDAAVGVHVEVGALQARKQRRSRVDASHPHAPPRTQRPACRTCRPWAGTERKLHVPGRPQRRRGTSRTR